MSHSPQQSRFEADREPAGKAPRTAAPADTAGGTEPVLTFDADMVARAIVFHMIDERLAREVAADSVRRTVIRLRRRGLRPAIRRSAWEVMTHHERLEWLLSESLTVPLMNPEGDVVSLEARYDR